MVQGDRRERRKLYVRETGEAVLAQDMDTDKVMGDHPKVSERKSRSTKLRSLSLHVP